MLSFLPHADRLFDHLWRPGHPFRPRTTNTRRWGMVGLLVFLYGTIFGYWYLTDATRVRAMAMSYLQDLTGGRVKIRSATLSVFEGLRLDDVQVFVDNGKSPDSLLFSADTFLIKYNQRAMLRGRLIATQIVAKRPHVLLTENVDTGRWNYHRLRHVSGDRPGDQSSTSGLIQLPEILLRDARVDYSEIRNDNFRSQGSMTIDGQLTTSTDGRIYNFQLQSRGATERVGPLVSGSINPVTGQISATLQNFKFGRDIATMLPAQVRRWWEQHELDGAVRVPDVVYLAAGNGRPASFRVVTVLEGVKLSVDPREWMGAQQIRRLERLAEGLAMMRSAGLNFAGHVDGIEPFVHPTSLRLQNVSGTFEFRPTGIDIKDLIGSVEDNTFKVDGSIQGYDEKAPANLKIESIAGQNVRIPHMPGYINAMPIQVREIYDLLRPEGVCSVKIELNRDTPEARPECTGEVNVIDGRFVYKLFPYPVQGATGKIVFGRDAQTGLERVDLRLNGHGVVGGPNANSIFTIDGWIGPFDESAGVNVRVEGKDIASEPAMSAAFPEHVQNAMKLFDADGRGEYPKFRGSFVCDIICAIGINTPFTVNTDIVLDDAAGKLASTPIKLEHVKGVLKIREGFIEIVKATMQRGDASLVVDGKVSWPTEPFSGARKKKKNKPISDTPPPILVPDLKITARGMPAEEILLSFLSDERVPTVKRLGLGGKIDADGMVKGTGKLKPTTRPGAVPTSDVDYDVSLTLREGTMMPDADGKPTVTGLEGAARLRPQGWEINNIRARRGEAELSAGGVIVPGDKLAVHLTAAARDLAVDPSLYNALPDRLKLAWDEIRPRGSVDADFSYHEGPTTRPADAPPAVEGYEVVLRPKSMSIEPKAVPYRLDDLGGRVIFRTNQVILEDVTGKHGPTRVQLSGTGATSDPGAWELKMRASELAVDDELLASLPKTLRGMLVSIKLRGKLGLDISRLSYREPIQKDGKPEIDLAATVFAYGAAMDLGTPLQDLTGRIDMAAMFRDGKIGEMRGAMDIASVGVADRTIRNFRAEIIKAADRSNLSLTKMQAEIAGGNLAGQVDLFFPDQGPSGFALNIVLRNADVKELAKITGQGLRGQLSASLAIEGQWGDLGNRRGRGDVTVSGRQMYQIPVLLGLMEITNLSLPVSSPFNEGTARYSVEGKRVAFEQIEMRSDAMLMKGSGYMDFGTKQVRMNFVTDNPNLPKLPFLHDILQGARQELFQIQVRGTIQEPKVRAASMGTFTTTIDEVFRGEAKK